MKKKLTMVAVVGLFFSVSIFKIFAGTQSNWGSSTGSSWNTPDDTAVTPNQFLVIGSTTGASPQVKALSQPALQSQTVSQITNSTAAAAGQIAFCSDCVASPVCISTGNSNNNQWVVVGASNTFTGGPFRCK